MEVNLGFDIDVSPRRLTIEIDKYEGIPEDWSLYLKDKTANTIHDLNQSGYEFDVQKTGQYSDRFSLILSTTSATLDLNEVVEPKSFYVYLENGRLNLASTKIIREIKMYDVLGNLIYQNDPYSNSLSLEPGVDLARGVIIIQAVLDDGTRVTRKALSY
jgi:hypothetical protein